MRSLHELEGRLSSMDFSRTSDVERFTRLLRHNLETHGRGVSKYVEDELRAFRRNPYNQYAYQIVQDVRRRSR